MKKKIVVALPLILASVIGVGFAGWAYGTIHTQDTKNVESISIAGYSEDQLVTLDYVNDYTLNSFENRTQSSSIVFKATYHGEPRDDLLYKYEIIFNENILEYIYPSGDSSDDTGISTGYWVSGTEMSHQVNWQIGKMPSTIDEYNALADLISTFSITVNVWIEEDLTAVPASISITTIPTSLVVGNTFPFGAIVSNAHGDQVATSINWSSSNTSVASFTNNVLAMHTKGQTTITAKDAENTVSTTLLVNVYNKTLNSIGFTNSSISLAKGTSQAVTLSVLPSDAYYKNLTYEVLDQTIISFNTSTKTISALKEGTTSINVSAVTENSIGNEVTRTGSLSVTVTPIPITAITISGTNAINVNETTTLSVAVTPVEATLGTINWSSLNTSIATVSSSGVVTGVSSGTATIKATLASNTSITDTYTVTVSASVDYKTLYNGYYASITPGIKGATLVSALQTINNNNVTSRSYDWKCETLDEHPDDSNSILCIYSRLPYAKTDHVANNKGYNREHVFPQSKISSTAATDFHHIFASDAKLNEYRDNNVFGVNSEAYNYDSYGRLSETKGVQKSANFEPCDAAKGEVARATFYVCMAYGYQVTSNFTSTALALEWNDTFGVTDREVRRNQICATTYQKNRNPFIDFPELAEICFDSSYSGPGAFV